MLGGLLGFIQKLLEAVVGAAPRVLQSLAGDHALREAVDVAALKGSDGCHVASSSAATRAQAPRRELKRRDEELKRRDGELKRRDGDLGFLHFKNRLREYVREREKYVRERENKVGKVRKKNGAEFF